MKKFDDLPIEKFDIMLIDVEGREYDVIKGGYQKISKNKYQGFSQNTGVQRT